jgi:cytochrome c5
LPIGMGTRRCPFCMYLENPVGKLRQIAMLLALAPGMAMAAGQAPAPSGRTVYESICIACHAPENVMVAAPKRGDANDWAQRLARSPKGIDTLTEHAIEGFGAMPAKGGAAELSRAEARLAIDYMMASPSQQDKASPTGGLIAK